MTRRASLKHLLGLGALGAGSGLGTALGLIVPSSLAASTDYRAVVCLHLGGGSDGNFLTAGGLPNLDGVGPIGDNLHSNREFCRVERNHQQPEQSRPWQTL